MKLRSYNGHLVRIAHMMEKTCMVQHVRPAKTNSGPIEKWDCIGPVYEVQRGALLDRSMAKLVFEPGPDKVVSLGQVEQEVRSFEQLPQPVIEHSALRGHGG